jgi:hypothetical protein
MTSFVTVTQEQFFAYVNPRNIHPTPFPDHSLWKNLDTHVVVGKTMPGYSGMWTPAGKAPQVYMLTSSAFAATTSTIGGQA